MEGLMHLGVCNIQFNCPYCEKEYVDSDDKYYNRIHKNKYGTTSTKCECGNKFGITSNIKGDLVSFKLK